VQLHHPDSADLAFLYGTILTDGNDAFSPDDATANTCVFADREVIQCTFPFTSKYYVY
jgi:trans-L-3-hydroxyproline dehydratase